MSQAVQGGPGEAADVIPAEVRDLLERPVHAHLATVRPDGTPQVNPTWVRYDGTYLWLTTTRFRQKTRNWQLQPVVALSFMDPDKTWRYLEVRGRVERILPDPGGEEFLRLAERYNMPQDGPPEDAADRIAVAIRPFRTTTM